MILIRGPCAGFKLNPTPHQTFGIYLFSENSLDLSSPERAVSKECEINTTGCLYLEIQTSDPPEGPDPMRSLPVLLSM
jgi:hypothetical protein